MRILAYALLTIVLFSAVGLIIFLIVHPSGNDAWPTVTALLAVIAAVISAWPALRVLEMQQDSQQPHPMPYFDLTSRYMFLQLRVRNLGASTAYNVRVIWDVHPRNEDGEKIIALDTISVLLPDESVSVLVGRSIQLFQKYAVMRFEGTVEFKDAAGKTRRQRFVCSADEHRKRLVHDEELPRTLYDLQKIPQELAEIRKAIEEFRR